MIQASKAKCYTLKARLRLISECMVLESLLNCQRLFSKCQSFDFAPHAYPIELDSNDLYVC